MKKLRRKQIVFLLLWLVIGLAACSRTPAAAPPTNTPAPTPTPPPTDTPAPTLTPTPTYTPIPPPTADLAIQQILLRYDPAQSLGNVELTVCNWGEIASSPFTVLVSTASGAQRQISYAVPIPPGNCHDLYETAADFNHYGITTPGEVEIQAVIAEADAADPLENNRLETVLTVPFLEPPERIPGAEEVALRAEEPRELLKVNAPYYSKAPLAYERLATLALVEMRNCMPRTAAYLGLPVPETVSWSYEIDPNSSDFRVAHPLNGILHTFSSPETIAEWAGWFLEPSSWEKTRMELCDEDVASNMARLLITPPQMPLVLADGLADLVGQRVAGDNAAAPVECREDGFYGPNFYGPGTEFRQYFPLAKSPQTDEEVANMFMTARCFWDYVETTYGQEKFQAVVQKLSELQGNASAEDYLSLDCNAYFVRDVLNPILGEDVTAVAGPRFGVDLLFTDCR